MHPVGAEVDDEVDDEHCDVGLIFSAFCALSPENRFHLDHIRSKRREGSS